MSTAFVKKTALKYFDSVGIAPAVRPTTMNEYISWLNEGYMGQMNYLKNHSEKKAAPQLLLEGAKSWIVTTLHYDTQEPLYSEVKDILKKEKKGWVARYARGPDYHSTISRLQKDFVYDLKKEFPEKQFLAFVDTKPVLERDTAKSGGLGWVGKNTCLIDSDNGSFFFIAEILTTLELEYDKPVADHCGTCTRCLDSCPTSALLEPYKLDATKCISYWTIESKTPAPEPLASKFGQNIFGCDICQDVCPWNQKARRTKSLPPTHSTGAYPLADLMNLSDDELKEKFKESALNRAKPQHFKENLKVALKNSEEN